MRVFVAGTKAEIQPVVQNKLIGSTASDFVATPFTFHSVASARGSADAIQFLAMLSFVSNLVHLSIGARAGTTPFVVSRRKEAFIEHIGTVGGGSGGGGGTGQSQSGQTFSGHFVDFDFVFDFHWRHHIVVHATGFHLVDVVISRRKNRGFPTELIFVQRDFATDRHFEGTDIVVFGLWEGKCGCAN